MRNTRKKQLASAARKVDAGKKNEVIRARAQDVFSNALARLGAGTPNLMEGTSYNMARLTRDYGLLNALYREHWIIRRIIDIIPSDMVKNWITLTTEVSPNLLKKMDLELRKTQLIQKIKTGLQWGRLFGGALGVMIVAGQGNDLSKPLNLQMIVPGDFCGLLVFDRWNSIDTSVETVDDIRDPEFGLPKYYTVTDNNTGECAKVHYSRVLRFTGDDLPYWESQAEQQWGASVIESVFDELKKRDNVSWNIAQLTFMASLRVLKMGDMGEMLSAADEQTKEELYRTIQAQNWLMSNMGMQVIDASDDFQTHQYTFGGIADVYKQFMIDIAGAANIPATKLFGRSPEGMNATGESDLTNYYDMVAQEQEAKLRPILNKLLPVICMSTFGAVPDDLDFEFDPVSEPSDKDRSDLAKSEAENVVTVFNAGLISQRTALKELKQQGESIGAWTNITDEDIQKASDQVEAAGEMGGYPMMESPYEEGEGQQMTRHGTGDSGKWLEDDHPRDEGGRFTSGGRSGRQSLRKIENFRKEIKIPKSEYARVMSALNTDTAKWQRREGRFTKAIGDYIYYVKVDRSEGYEHFKIYGKIKIR
ncbi:DUF1073 domain-containing protein [uncultured Dialister sp.]|uniref:phage portal protein n=1 Tax=uncultured Dialister sp. TaxID=278064 RepID=UPI0026DB648D|nr:DUF1073 domain-containing protein [uncultured Dialister sp.]